jgi:hypothetical protein
VAVETAGTFRSIGRRDRRARCGGGDRGDVSLDPPEGSAATVRARDGRDGVPIARQGVTGSARATISRAGASSVYARE